MISFRIHIERRGCRSAETVYASDLDHALDCILVHANEGEYVTIALFRLESTHLFTYHNPRARPE